MADEIAETNPIRYEVRRTGIGRVVRAISAHAVVLDSGAADSGPGDVRIVVEISDADGTESVLIDRTMAAHLSNTIGTSFSEANRLVEELT